MSISESTRLLKAPAVRDLGSRVTFNYEDIQTRCEEYLSQTKERVRQLLSEAASEASRTCAEAETKGYRQGYETGLKNAQVDFQARVDDSAKRQIAAALEPVQTSLTSALDGIQLHRERALREWEQAVVGLSLKIAERIVRQTLPRQPEIVPGLVQEALRLVGGAVRVQLRLNPKDEEFLRTEAAEMWETLEARELKIVPDEKITRGGCVVQTLHGEVDARLETQLSRIASELLGEP